MFELDYLAPPIFTTTSASSAFYVGIVHLLGVCAGIPLIDTVGRRPIIYRIIWYLRNIICTRDFNINITINSSFFLYQILEIIYMFLYQIGPQATFFVLSSEILPTKIRAISLCIWNALLYFVDSLLLVFYTSVTNRAVWFYLWSIGSLISGILLLMYLDRSRRKGSHYRRLKKNYDLLMPMGIRFDTLIVKYKLNISI